MNSANEYLLDKDLINRSVEIVEPSIEALLRVPGMTWGPKHVNICILINLGEGTDRFGFTVGQQVEWNPKWGEDNIQSLAYEKAFISAREQNNTSSLSVNSPWLFREHEHLYSGGIYYAGISIGVSGADEIVDQHIAEMILFQIMLFARMKAKTLKNSQV
ncbi:MAG: hypothetical protein WC422_00475 [Candidatus Paceibacterota bacterium]|jgi:hypothetical protein